MYLTDTRRSRAGDECRTGGGETSEEPDDERARTNMTEADRSRRRREGGKYRRRGDGGEEALVRCPPLGIEQHGDLAPECGDPVDVGFHRDEVVGELRERVAVTMTVHRALHRR